MAGRRHLFVLTALLLLGTSCGSGNGEDVAPAGPQQTTVPPQTTQPTGATIKPEPAVDSRDLTYDITQPEGHRYRFIFRLSQASFPVIGNRACNEFGDSPPGRRYVRIPYSIINLLPDRGAPVPLFGTQLDHWRKNHHNIELRLNRDEGCSETRLQGQYSASRGIFPNGTMRGVLNSPQGNGTIDESANYHFLFRFSKQATVVPEPVSVPLAPGGPDRVSEISLTQYLKLLSQGQIQTAAIIERQNRIEGMHKWGQYSLVVKPEEMPRLLSALEDAGVRLERR
ncbi:MAG: hypothetical protein ACREX3_12680 [Gammaproteobacteria bacterium]